jgi:hypothetical protein
MTQPRNRAVEFHDSTLAGVSQIGAKAVLHFSAVYVHESVGEPGVDAGSGWYQPSTFTIAGGRIVSPASTPATLVDGFVRAGGTLHRNVVPVGRALSGRIELSISSSAGETLVVHGDTLTIELCGEPSHAEDFPAATPASN